MIDFILKSNFDQKYNFQLCSKIEFDRKLIIIRSQNLVYISFDSFQNMDWTRAMERILKLAVSFLNYFFFSILFTKKNLEFISVTESFDLVDFLLPFIPLIFKHHGRNSQLCRPQLLQRLVELRWYRCFLEDLEFACSSMGRKFWSKKSSRNTNSKSTF